MKRNDKIIFSLAFAIIVAIVSVTFEDFSLKCAEVRENTLRLHILANSDSNDDQRLKLKVRDAVLNEYGKILGGCKDRNSAEKTIVMLKDDIKRTAEKVLIQEGCENSVKVNLTEMYFDNKKYDDNIIMPAGIYDAVRIEIGDAEGKNWWCVMYPPLCVPVYCEEQAQEAADTIKELNSYPAFEARFAVVELGEKLKERLKNH